MWAALIEVNRERLRRGGPPIANFQEWCRQMTGVPLGGLARICAEGIAKRYCDAFMETARRRRRGEPARYPRRKRALFPVRFRTGEFGIDGSRVRLATARGTTPLSVRLARPVPYPIDAVRSLTLLVEDGRLCLDVTAAIAVEDHDLDPTRVGGVDLGIIHPFAVAAGDEALLVSGRLLRAEERLHLADTKARARKMAPKAPRRGQRGSRRWRKLRVRQRRAEARHRRRIHHTHHQAATTVVSWAVARRISTLVVGDPAGITQRDAGRRQNLRLRQWRRTHLMAALADKAELAGIQVVRVDERGTSSSCPECHRAVPKPAGRTFSCPHCGQTGHRDLVAARNIAARGGGTTSTPVLVTHRRAGLAPARRDRRRHLMDQRRSSPAPGRPPNRGSRSPANRTRSPTRGTVHVTTTPDEDQQRQPDTANVA